jgi:hypothetical protein
MVLSANMVEEGHHGIQPPFTEGLEGQQVRRFQKYTGVFKEKDFSEEEKGLIEILEKSNVAFILCEGLRQGALVEATEIAPPKSAVFRVAQHLIAQDAFPARLNPFEGGPGGTGREPTEFFGYVEGLPLQDRRQGSWYKLNIPQNAVQDVTSWYINNQDRVYLAHGINRVSQLSSYLPELIEIAGLKSERGTK